MVLVRSLFLMMLRLLFLFFKRLVRREFLMENKMKLVLGNFFEGGVVG